MTRSQSGHDTLCAIDAVHRPFSSLSLRESPAQLGHSIRSPGCAFGGTGRSWPQSGQRTVAVTRSPGPAATARGRNRRSLRSRRRSPGRPCGLFAPPAPRARPRPQRRSSLRTPRPSAKETLSPSGRRFRSGRSRRSRVDPASPLLEQRGHRIAPHRRGPAAATSVSVSIRPGRDAVASHAVRCSTEQKKLMSGHVYVCSGRVRSRSAAHTTAPAGACVTAPFVRVSANGVPHA